MANQDIYGTEGNDVYTVGENTNYWGQAGDDIITLSRWSSADGGAGNDTITVPSDVDPLSANVWYWSSQNPIYVDLEQGYALDGYGTRDTLINVHNVHGFKFDGDRGYGSTQTDFFWIGADWNVKTGHILIDGRGGIDQATFGAIRQNGFLVLEASLDLRVVTAYYSNNPGFSFELRNIERIYEWNFDLGINTQYELSEFIDFSSAGQDLLLRGNTGWQTGQAGNPVVLTYAFLDAAPTSGAEGGTNVTPWSASQKAAVLSVFGKLWEQTGLSFVEATADTAQLRLGINQQTGTKGYAFVPDQYRGDARAGDVWLDIETAAAMTPGSEGYYVLLHEIGHALGLQHPLLPTDTSGATVLPESQARFTNTLMMETTPDSDSSHWPTWFGGFDLQALRYLYGTRPYASGNDYYKITDGQSMTLVDDGGGDTLDASATGISAYIDLRPGAQSSIGLSADGKALYKNMAIAHGTVIESAVGTRWDDHIIGNASNNWLAGNGGNDLIEGGAGFDWAVIPGQLAQMNLSRSIDGEAWDLVNTDGISGSVRLTEVERIQLSDGKIALTRDIKVNDTAAVIAAALGRSGFENLAAVGVVLGYMEAGGTATSGASVLVNAGIMGMLAGGTDNATLLRFVLGNLELQTSTRLESIMNTQGQEAFFIAAVNSAESAQLVDLVGIETSGMAYV